MKIHHIDEEVQQEIAKMLHLAGIDPKARVNQSGELSPLTQSGTAKGEYMKRHNIRPGSREWFQLWFARPDMTGEDPMPLDRPRK